MEVEAEEELEVKVGVEVEEGVGVEERRCELGGCSRHGEDDAVSPICRPKQHTYACIQCNPSAEPFKDHHMWTMIKKMLVLMTLDARRAHCQGSKANDVR